MRMQDHEAPTALPRTLRAKGALWVLMDKESQLQVWLLICIRWLHEISFFETRGTYTADL